MLVDQQLVDQLVVDQLLVDQLLVDQLLVDQLLVDQRKLEGASGSERASASERALWGGQGGGAPRIFDQKNDQKT